MKQVFNPETILSVLQGDFLTSEYESRDAHSQEDDLFLDILIEGICYKESRYEMPLTFKQDRPPWPPLLPNNQGVAYHRLMSLKKKLLQEKQYQADYVATMIDFFDNGYAEETQFIPMSHDLVPE